MPTQSRMNVTYMTQIETKTINDTECLESTHLSFPRYQGKARDCYDLGDTLLLISTDRISAFDRNLGLIPHKGQILNQLSAWWFEKTQHITPNHFIELTTSNAMRVRKCRSLPIEVIVRAYLTGSTQTSIWTQYQQGERRFFDTVLPNGLAKNTRLAKPILTPTTKALDHDKPLTPGELIQFSGLTSNEWKMIGEKALQLFQLASEYLLTRGLILVDSKYEFGYTETGELILIDELHTPDSSRYWLASEHEKNPAQVQNFDKEVLRQWYKKHCNPYHDETLPAIPKELSQTISERYQYLYETITQQKFRKEKPSCVASLVLKASNL